MSLEPGSLLAGKYQIQDEIGKGAYGRVYRARDTSLGRDVAIKELRKGGEVGSTDYADYVRRFEREAQVQAGFIHPNIVQVYELVKPETEGDAYYLVMEYVDGKSLKEVLERGGPLPPDKALGIFCDILNGLEAVHAGPRDIVHRDIKPSNILLTRSDQAKLADFGQAQVRDESMRTRTGQPHPGTPVYMSPEQETTQAYLYPASDIFSAGCVLFEMLTGQGYKSARSRGQSLADLRPDLPARVGKALEKALAEDRASRYPSAGEFAKALGCPGRAEPAPQPAPHKTGLPTWAWIVGGLAVFFVVVAALGAIGALFLDNQRQSAALTHAAQTQAAWVAAVTPSPAVSSLAPTLTTLPAQPLPSATASSVPTPMVELGANLLVNPDFEAPILVDGVSGWAVHSRHVAGVFSAQGQDGQAYCSQQNLGESEAVGWVGFAQDVVMAPDTLYLLKGELLYENAVQLHVLVEWRSNDQQVGREILYNVGGIPPDGITAGAWMPFEVMFRSPGGIDEGRIHIWHGVINNQTNVPGGQFCADNFWLSTVIE